MTSPQSNIAEIRQKINIAFDDSNLSAFCLIYFSDVYNNFTQGMRKDDKITLLLDYCHRHSTRFKRLLDNVRQEYQQSNSQREELKPVIDALSTYIDSSLRIAKITTSLPPVIGDKERRNLHVLLDKVKQFWIEGVLEKSVYSLALINLGKETQAEAVAHAWEQILELPDQSRQTLPPDKKISQIFDDMSRTLLILGEPGSGKTTTLLELARDLIKRFEDDETFSQPVPVIFNLSTWTNQREPLIDWLVAELSQKYLISKQISRPWLENNRLLLLLDGLDEVKPENRAACVEAINQFGEEFGLSGLVVCSRLKEYSNLPVRLKFTDLNGAIRLLPLTLEQVYNYLDEAGAKLDALRIALKNDKNLQELAQSPLTLGIMTLAYQDMTAEDLSSDFFQTLEARRKHLFNTYIKRILKRKGQGSKKYTDKQLQRWLAWLADRMIWHGHTIFLVEQLQPSWLPSWSSRYFYVIASRLGGIFTHWLVGLLWGALVAFVICAGIGAIIGFMYFELPYQAVIGPIIGLVLGVIYALFIICITFILSMWAIIIICGITLGIIDSLRLRWKNEHSQKSKTPLYLQVVNVLATGILTWLAFALIYGMAGLLIGSLFGEWSLGALIGSIVGLLIGFFSGTLGYGVIFGLRSNRQDITNDIQPVESLTWSWKRALKGGGYALIYGIGLGLIYDILFLSVIIYIFNTPYYHINYIGIFLGNLIATFTFVLAGIAFGGLKSKVLEEKAYPNQGIRLSLKNAIFTSLPFGFIFTLIVSLIFGIGMSIALFFDGIYSLEYIFIIIIYCLIMAVTIGPGIGLFAALWYGGLDVIQHYTLRFIFWRKNYMPCNYVPFLDYAVKHVFLHKVGGGYIFVHRLLMEHFANLEQEPLSVDRSKPKIRFFSWWTFAVGIIFGLSLFVIVGFSLGGQQAYTYGTNGTISSRLLVMEGEQLVQQGNVEEAIYKYTEAETIKPDIEITADSWNQLCWFGSLWEHPADVMYACEEAVRLAPDNAGIRDSRGVARALLGDYKGAIEDFEFFVEWTIDNGQYEQYGRKREIWITELQKGENPFTKTVLEELRNEN